MVSAGLRRQSQDGGSGGKEMTAMMLIVPFYAPAFDSFDFSVCLIWLFGGVAFCSHARGQPEGVLTSTGIYLFETASCQNNDQADKGRRRPFTTRTCTTCTHISTCFIEHMQMILPGTCRSAQK